MKDTVAELQELVTSLALKVDFLFADSNNHTSTNSQN